MPNMKKALINIVHDRHFTRDDPTNWVIKCNNKECHYYIELGPYAYDEYLFILDDNKVIILNKGVRETLIGKTLEFFWPGSIRFGTNYICKDCLKTSFIDNDERYECEHCKKRNLVTGDYSVGKLCPKCIKGKFIKDSLLPDGTFFGTDHLYDPNHIYWNRIPSSEKKKGKKMTKVDWTRKKTSDSALRSRDIDLVRFYFGNYELIAQRKTSGTVDAFFDLSLYNKGHYTGAYLLLPHHKFVDLMRHLKTITNPAEDDIPPRMPIRMKIDKYLHLEISKSKKLVGECIVIKKVLTESDKTVTPRQIFFPLKVVNNDRLYELMNK